MGQGTVGYRISYLRKDPDADNGVIANLLDGEAPIGTLVGINSDKLHLETLEFTQDRPRVLIDLYQHNISLPAAAWRALARSL